MDTARFSGTVFEGNLVFSGSQPLGGAIFASNVHTLWLEHCAFSRNGARGEGGAFSQEGRARVWPLSGV